MPGAPARVVGTLGTTQTLAWASSYYLPAMLADPIARDLGVSAPTVYAAFSIAMVASALAGPWAGQAIDHRGGRIVLVGTSLLFALGLGMLGAAQDLWMMVTAWLVIGVAMGSGLYEAAFSSLVRLYGHHARGAITGITLIAGFASTVGWPLSAWMETVFGWRGACFGWAVMHLLIGLPLNAGLPKVPAVTKMESLNAANAEHGGASPAPESEHRQYAIALLAFVFAATWFITTAMATHLPRILEATGTTLSTAVAVGALIGPAQVAGRLFEFGLLRQVHPLLSARLAAVAHPAGVAVLLTVGPAMAPVFAILHGAGNGILTIAKGTLPLALFGPMGYGARQGWLMMPARVAQALAPFAFGVALDAWGASALWLSGGIGLAACVALLLLHARPVAH